MKQKIGLATALNGAAAVGPQLIALVVLESLDFGLFSAIYLLFALGVATALSIICDPWAIAHREKTGEVATFTLILLIISCVFGVLSISIAFLLGANASMMILSFLCVSTAVYRSGARYYLVTLKRWTRVLLADLSAVVGLAIGLTLVFAVEAENILLVFLVWLISSVLAIVFGPYPISLSIRRVFWIAENRRIIQPLLVDSLILEASSVGTPYILLPIIGLSNFGIYRGISNLSAPIRLLFSPLRPMIVANPSAMMHRRRIIGVLAIAFAAAGGAYAALNLVLFFNFSAGVLSEVANFSVAASLYIWGSVLLSLFPLVVRASGHQRDLFIGRVFQTVVGCAFPLIGFFVWGLNGALWLFSIATVLSAVLWLFFAFKGRT